MKNIDFKANLIAAFIVAIVSIPVGFLYLSVYDLSLSPVENWRNDLVSPRVVTPGSMIAVHRTFTVTRNASLTITRSLVKGDCTRQCDIRDLPSSVTVVEPGEYKERVRMHTIPNSIEEGVWKLRFYAHWQNRLGQKKTIPLPEMEIEVIKGPKVSLIGPQGEKGERGERGRTGKPGAK